VDWSRAALGHGLGAGVAVILRIIFTGIVVTLMELRTQAGRRTALVVIAAKCCAGRRG